MDEPLDAPARRPITGGAVMGAASRIAVAVTGAAASIAVARILGREGTGAYTIALTSVLVLTVFTTFGAERGIAYYVSSGRWAARSALRRALGLALLSGVAGAGLGVALRIAFPSAFGGLSVGMSLVVMAALPFSLAMLYATLIAVAVDAYEAFVIPPALQSGLMCVLVAGLAAAFDVWGVVAGITASYALAGAYTVHRARRWLPPGGADDPGDLRGAVSFGVRGYAANALQMINYRLDLFILSAVAGAAQVGIYAVAVAVTMVMWLLPPALSDVLFPRVSALSASDHPDAEAHRSMVERKALRHTVLIVLATAIAVAIALVLLVVPVYGEAFRPAIELGLILLPGAAIYGLAGPMSAIVVGRGHPEYPLYVVLVSTPVTLLLYVLLIRAHGATGAAIASSVSYALTTVGMVIALRVVTGRGSLRAMVPTRAELADYRCLPAALRAWRARA
ncbi:unannotated protein [freshwater metagenome]|uniref:Unannotated protein n=1 Tax=freshwater metagenome TaxID=449393 RepID=A0A6J7HL37_9ZZZZ|nr:oligosaccharide flippase family protein [Actinomycetota bacterium]